MSKKILCVYCAAYADCESLQSCSLCFRYELVPKKVREDEFWRNYFYRVSLIKQSFDLKDFEANSNATNQQNSRTEIETSNNVAEEEVVDHHLHKYETCIFMSFLK